MRHILGISGGKDSAALGIFMKDRIPEMEYVFCDTGSELKETYQYIDKLEVLLNKHIIRVPKELPAYSEKMDFDHYLKLYGGYLPNANSRWCTKQLKLAPFEMYIGNDDVINYVGIRADEAREGYISTRDNVKTVFPFIENGIDKDGVLRILNEAGVGMPEYYKWRSRSGCYFCFFQRLEEWVSLQEHHPDLWEKAKSYEKEGFTWRQDYSLADLEDEDVKLAIREKALSSSPKKRKKANASLIEILDEVQDPEDIEKPCIICHL